MLCGSDKQRKNIYDRSVMWYIIDTGEIATISFQREEYHGTAWWKNLSDGTSRKAITMVIDIDTDDEGLQYILAQREEEEIS